MQSNCFFTKLWGINFSSFTATNTLLSLDCLMICSYAQTGLCGVSKKNYYFPDVNLLMLRRRLTDSSFLETRNETRGMQRPPGHSTERITKDVKEVVKKTILVHGMWQRLGQDCYTRKFSRMI